jgi:hypothetical protein
MLQHFEQRGAIGVVAAFWTLKIKFYLNLEILEFYLTSWSIFKKTFKRDLVLWQDRKKTLYIIVLKIKMQFDPARLT